MGLIPADERELQHSWPCQLQHSPLCFCMAERAPLPASTHARRWGGPAAPRPELRCASRVGSGSVLKGAAGRTMGELTAPCRLKIKVRRCAKCREQPGISARRGALGVALGRRASRALARGRSALGTPQSLFLLPVPATQGASSLWKALLLA